MCHSKDEYIFLIFKKCDGLSESFDYKIIHQNGEINHKLI